MGKEVANWKKKRKNKAVGTGEGYLMDKHNLALLSQVAEDTRAAALNGSQWSGSQRLV